MQPNIYKSLQEYIQIEKLKNGKFRFSNTALHEANIYRLLLSLGYSLKRVNGKIEYYKQTGNSIEPVSMTDIRVAFRNHLLQNTFIDLPEGLDIDLVVNWFWHHKGLIRENDHFRGYLESTYS